MIRFVVIMGICVGGLSLTGCNQQPSDSTPGVKIAETTPVINEGIDPHRQASKSAAASREPAGPTELQLRIRECVKKLSVLDSVPARLTFIGQGLQKFMELHQEIPFQDGDRPLTFPNKTGLSWRVHLLPFLGETKLYNQFALDEPWDSPHNYPLISQMPAFYGDSPAGKTYLHVFEGEKVPFKKRQEQTRTSLKEIVDDPATTLLVVDSGRPTAQFWTQPGGLVFDPEKPVEAVGDVGTLYWGLMMDGQVYHIPVKNPELLKMIQLDEANPSSPPGQLWQREIANQAAENSQPGTATAGAELPPLKSSKKRQLQFLPKDVNSALILQPRRLLEDPLVEQLIQRANWTEKPSIQFLTEQIPEPYRKQITQFGLPLNAVEELHYYTISPVAQTKTENVPSRAMPPRPGAFSPQTDAGMMSSGMAPGVSARVSPAQPLAVPATPAFGIPGACLVMHSALPLPVEKIIEELFRLGSPPELVEERGISYFVTGIGLVVGFADEQVLLFGSQRECLQQMITAPSIEQNQSLVARQLKSSPPDLLTIAVDLSAEKMGPQLALLAMSPSTQPLLPILSEMQTATLHFNLEKKNLLEVDLQTRSKESAQHMIQLIEEQKKTSAVTEAGITNLVAPLGLPDLAPILQELFQETRWEQKQQTVSLTIKKTFGLADLPEALEPRFQMFRDAALLAERKEMLKELGQAFHKYHDLHEVLPALDGHGDPTNTQRGLSWRVHLLPFLGENKLYEKFHLNEPWSSPHNLKLAREMPLVYGRDPEGRTAIQVLVGPGTPFHVGDGIRLRDVRDGMSSTILAIEAVKGTGEIWTMPEGMSFNPRSPTKYLETNQSYLLLMMDGSVRSITGEIDPETFRRLVHHTDGEEVGEF